MKNYYKIERRSLFYAHYAFFDIPEYYADQIFISHRIKVRFGREMAKPDEPYVIIFCRVRKRDEAAFLESLLELNHKMQIMGHTDYDEFCEKMTALLEA